METKEIFAKRVIALRKEKGISQSQLADLVGISKTSANLYESASRVPDIQVLARYAIELEVTTDYLLGLSDNKTSENAAIGEEIGLWDDTIEKLRWYKRISDACNDFTSGTTTEESLAFLEEVAGQEFFGKTPEEIREHFRWFGVILNDVMIDSELINLIGAYFVGYLFPLDNLAKILKETDRAALALLKLQAYIITRHDDYVELHDKGII